MNELEHLEEAIAALEAQRGVLHDDLVNAALQPLRQRLAALTQEASRAQPTVQGERRFVTVLFCDVAGSTATAEQLDPEEWTRIMGAAFHRLIEPVDRYGGTVARLMGDAILAFFGAPTSHEDDPQRAVLAGLGIPESILPLREQLYRQRHLDLNVRVGINTGLVVVSEVGTDIRSEYTAMGDAVNLAARMEQTAEPGTLQIAEATYRLVAPFFEVEDLGSIRVKGKRHPVSAYRVVGQKDKPGSLRGLHEWGISSPLVGREVELALVGQSIDRLLKGQGAIIAVFGEAGLGKSRLMAEVHRNAPLEGLTWLEGRSLSYGQSVPYRPFQEILRQFADIKDDDSAIAAWQKLEDKISALFTEDKAEILPYLAHLLALDAQGEYAERLRYLDAESVAHQLFLASRRFFQRLAQDKPLVLLFEDFHWADESSARLLEHLLPLVARVPMLMILVSRPETVSLSARLKEFAAQQHPNHYAEINLPPLSTTKSNQLVDNLLSIGNLPVQVRQEIAGKADGNPFFIEEIIRLLVESGTVIRDQKTGHWRAPAEIELAAIPDTLHGLIMERIDRLDENTRQVLCAAAVIGRSFRHRLLHAVCDSILNIGNHLNRLLSADLIRTRLRAPEPEYVFKHVLVQEATYHSILIQNRRKLHARVAQAMELLFADQLERYYSQLAYQFAQAEQWERAQLYLLKAGDQAGEVAADAEALLHYQQAINAFERSLSDHWQPLQRASLERKMGVALLRRGDHQKALTYMHRALGFLGKNPPPPTGWRVKWAILREIAHHARLHRSRGPATADEGGPSSPEDEEMLQIVTALGKIYAYTDQELFIWNVFMGLNYYERIGSDNGVALGLAGIGFIADMIPIFWLAERYHNRAVTLAEAIRFPHAVGFAHAGKAFHSMHLAKWDEVLKYTDQAIQAYEKTGDLRQRGFSLFIQAGALIYLGRFDQALAHSQEILQSGEDAADAQMTAWGGLTRGIVLRRIGRFGEAVTLLEKALALARTIPDYTTSLWSGSELARCQVRLEQVEPALTAIRKSGKLYEESGLRAGAGSQYLISKPAVYLAVAEQIEAKERSIWLKKGQYACKEALRNAKAFHPSLPEAMLLRGRCEWLTGRPGAAHRWWQRGLKIAEEFGQLYDVGMLHLEIGRRLEDRMHLESAESVFAEMGLANINNKLL